MISAVNRHNEYVGNLPDSRTVIIFTHGIMGSPIQFADLAEDIKYEYSFANLLLPGHGKTVREYSASNMNQWQKYLNDRIKSLEGHYDNIILAGHSMGGLLSIRAALSRPERICGLFLLALPLKIKMSPDYIKRGLKIVFHPGSKDPKVIIAQHSSSVPLRSWLAQIRGIPRVFELFLKARETRKIAADLCIPISVFFSRHDEIVSIKSARYLSVMQNARVGILEESGHYDYSDADRLKIRRCFHEFIKEVTSKYK